VNRVLIPALPTLLAAHPGLRIDLIAEPRDLSLTKREADIAVRLARPRGELRTLARRIGHLDYAVFGPGERTDALPWITYDDMLADLPQAKWITAQIKNDPVSEPHVRVNDAEALVWALQQGLGKSLIPTVIGDREPGLCRLGDPSPPVRREIWLLTHPELRDLRRVQVTADWLAATLGPLPVGGTVGRSC